MRKTYNSNFHTCKHTLRMIVIYTVEEISSIFCMIVYCSLRTPGPFHCYDKLIVHINYPFWSSALGQNSLTYSLRSFKAQERKIKPVLLLCNQMYRKHVFKPPAFLQLLKVFFQIWKWIKSLNKSIQVLTKCIFQLPATKAQVKYEHFTHTFILARQEELHLNPVTLKLMNEINTNEVLFGCGASSPHGDLVMWKTQS